MIQSRVYSLRAKFKGGYTISLSPRKKHVIYPHVNPVWLACRPPGRYTHVDGELTWRALGTVGGTVSPSYVAESIADSVLDLH